MKVFKFGGASVKDAEGARNMAGILAQYKDEELVVVVSAMGKTTNALEKVVEIYFQKGDWKTTLHEVTGFHRNILENLFPGGNGETASTVDKIEQYCHRFLEQEAPVEYDFTYDQIVATGELLSTKIIAAYLASEEFEVLWADARKFIRTNNHYRDAAIDWKTTRTLVQDQWNEVQSVGKIMVTQGFIGGGGHNRITTLGREGSDYSAAVIAYCLGAESVTIWKDVPGVLNADPKFFNNPQLLPNISYREAVELAYYGATIIHPKTIKPLQNKNIPLHVKSFLDPSGRGTVINQNASSDNRIPSYIFKDNQVLLSIASKDFSFMQEDNISEVYSICSRHKVKVNTVQNSAISLSISVTNDKQHVPGLMEELKGNYDLKYNEGLELLTVRHYNEKILQELLRGKEVLLEQKTRTTARILMRGEKLQ